MYHLMDKDFFNAKTVLIMGLGRFGGGADSALFAHHAGAKVIITDLAGPDELADTLAQLAGCQNIEYHLAGHNQADFGNEGADIIIVNPAVHPDNNFLRIARRTSRVITSQIEIFFELCPARIVGVTGANGKSTTAAITACLLEAAAARQEIGYEKVWLSGNIGDRPLLAGLNEIAPNDIVVLELSSFQLEQLANIKKAPYVSVITNLTTFKAYCHAKDAIFRFQHMDENTPAVSIFNAEDKLTAQWHKRYYEQKGRLCMDFKVADISNTLAANFALPGRMNLSNLAAAAAVAKHFGLSDNHIAETIKGFKPLPHRLELISRIDGVSWYNDSISTTPASTMAALEAFNCPKIIIAGGYDKNLPFDELGDAIARSAKAAVLIGQTAEKIAKAVSSTQNNRKVITEIADSLPQAVNYAKDLAETGDVVLLSPACASYDMFENFRRRGEIFCELVKQLQE